MSSLTLTTPLSNEQVCDAVPGSAWLKYNELAHYNTVDEVLALSPIGVIFLLILIEDNSTGHWCVLFAKEDAYHWFDPYGYVCDSELSFLSADKRRELKEDTPLLMNLMLKSSQNKPWTWSSFDFQRHDSRVQDCGRWCVLRARNLDKTDDEFRAFVTQEAKSKKESFDTTCLRLTADVV